MNRKIYLAGPEVFHANATALGWQKQALCREYGFEGLFPLDSEIAPRARRPPRRRWRSIMQIAA